MYGAIRRIHLVGIGGTGMSGIGEVLLNRGYAVSGSDIAASEVTERLQGLGATITIGHDAACVEGADILVVSSAIGRDNPEVQAALGGGVPIVPRAEMLAELMRTRYGVAVAGAHGKTTTTSLVGAILAAGNLDPTVVVGGRLKAFGTGAQLGAGDFFVAEADESDGSFLMLSPAIAVVTNIDLEHVEHYGTLEAIMDAFRRFVNKVPFYGVSILCVDDPLVQRLLPDVKRRVVTYGTTPEADLHIASIAHDGLSSRFEVEGVGSFELPMPGRHNVANATAALAVGRELGIAVSGMRTALAGFRGVGRRFDVVRTRGGVTLVDDYGHHPTEVRAVLETARGVWNRRITCIFQPHRYSRTQALWKEFGSSFSGADRVWILPVYPAGEAPIPGVDARLLYRAAREAGHEGVRFLDVSVDDVAERLVPELSEGDVVVTLGAGNVWRVHRALVERLGRDE